MSRPFDVRRPLDTAYTRNMQFAIELIDPVTLSRVSQGVKVVAAGLRGKPIVNSGGMFVWFKEDTGPLREIVIDPGILPFEKLTVPVSDLNLLATGPRLTTIELPPRADYGFSAGITGIHGTLLEARVVPPVFVQNAEVHLQWLDEDGITWRNAPTRSHTNEHGDFVSIIRMAPDDIPRLEASGTITVRLLAKRSGAGERHSVDVELPLGRVSDRSSIDTLKFAWDELHP